MLAWRAVSTRTAVFSRQNVTKTARLVHSTPPRLQGFGRSGTLAAKIWFRNDGTPRSKLKGLAIGGFSFVTALTLYTLIEVIQELDTANYVLACLVLVQRADTEYNTVDLSNSYSTRSYFYQLCLAIPDTPTKVLDGFFADLTEVLDSSRSESADAHRFMKEASEEVHELLRKLGQDEAVEVGLEIVRVLDRTIVALVDLLEDVLGGEDSDKMTVYLTLKDRKAKDTSSKGTDYETIG